MQPGKATLTIVFCESGKRIADRLKTSTQTVSKWRRRYQIYRFSGLTDAPKTGRLGQLKRRHRSAEFLQFLNAVDATVPADMDIHLNHGQLRHAQNPEGSRLVCRQAPLPRALHADLCVMAELGGAVLRTD